MRSLHTRMGFVTPIRLGSLYRPLLEPGTLQVDYADEPLDKAEAERVTPIFPPGTEVELIEAKARGELRPDDLTQAFTILSIMNESGESRLKHGDSIDILNFIMSREGKYALRAALAAQGGGQEFRSTLDAIHQLLGCSLGVASYRIAVRERIIAGNAWGQAKSHVQQVGGALSPITTKWHIGIKSDDSQTAKDRLRDA